MIRSLVLSFLLSLSFIAQAQSPNIIKGIVVNERSLTKLSRATVMLLTAKDSMLIDVSYSAHDGSFSLKNVNAGKYLLVFGYPDHADQIRMADLSPMTGVLDLGTIRLRSKSDLLREVIVKSSRELVRLKGDTSVFDAKAFVIQPNDKVEDLLKQLPGIQIDQNGRITAHGQRVYKVLLDGEEFFGDDPTLVTKNIRADMVAKVQLYDKKSERADFTGIEDGKRAKTINIILKEDKKKGLFGKVNIGKGDRDIYEAAGILNKFTAGQKYAIFATGATNGKVGLNGSDASKIGAESMQAGSRSLLPSGTDGDALDSYNGSYDGRGLPKTRTAGAHFDTKWDNSGKLNTNYQAGAITLTGNNSAAGQQDLPGGPLLTSTNENYRNYAFRQKADLMVQHKLSTSDNIKVIIDGTQKNFEVTNSFSTSRARPDDGIVSQQARSVNNKGDQKQLEAEAYYSKKFDKARRTFTADLIVGYLGHSAKGYLFSTSDFFAPNGQRDSSERVDQYKTSVLSNSSVSAALSFNEPLSKYLTLSVNYSFEYNKSHLDRQTLANNGNGVYDRLDPTYTNLYDFTQKADLFGATLNLNKPKTILNIGSNMSRIGFRQTDVLNRSVFKRDFLNWLPRLFYRYEFSSQRSLSFMYNGNNVQPSVEQLQPVATNIDPLNIMTGNRDLASAYDHFTSLNFRINDVINNQGLLLQADQTLTQHAIIGDIRTDLRTGKSATGFTNLKDKLVMNIYLFADMYKKLKVSEITINFSLSDRTSRSYSMINGVLNRSNNTTYSASLGASKNKRNAYSISCSVGPNYQLSSFSLNPDFDNKAAGLNARLFSRLYLPAKWQLETQMNYAMLAATRTFSRAERTVINASVGRTFLKSDNLKVTVAGNDLLKQNILFNRAISGNMATQLNAENLTRYFLFSISWDFTKFGTSPAN